MQAFVSFSKYFAAFLRKSKAAFPSPNNEQRTTKNDPPSNEQPATNDQTVQRYKLALWFLAFCLGLNVAAAQDTLTRVAPDKVPLRFRTTEADKAVLRKYKFKREAPDSLSAVQVVRNLVLALQKDAYLTASADSFFLKKDTLFVDLYIGQPFKWVALKNGNLSEGLLQKSGFRERFYRNKPFNPDDFVKLQKRVVEYTENSGYPFASLKLDSVQITGNGEVQAIARLTRGPLITFDSVVVQGRTKTQSRFLSRYLQIRPGQPYEHRKVENSLQLLKQLPYLQVSRAPQVRFAENKARLYYFIEDRNANQIDALIGVLPPDENAEDKKVMLIWEGNLNIRNIKGTGIQLGLQARKVDRNSQVLDANYLQPNILGSPLEMSVNFNLYKQDTTFMTIKPRLEFGYYTTRYGKVSFFTQSRSSRLLSTANLKNLTSMPEYADVKYTSFGAAYLWNNLDDFYFPRKGLLISGQLALGNKTIVRNLALEPQSIYDTLKLKTTQFTGSLRVENYAPIGKNGVLLARLRGENLVNEQIFLNDMFRLGGLNLLRGFNDYEFYASSYLLSTLEYRFFTAEDSYLLLFYDQAYYQSKLPGAFNEDMPLGIGAGVSFSTPAGVFQFVYSVGRSELQKQLSLTNSRVHFGLASKF
ncbi:BamA/TamA family outer membrane protein [Adhaeribacter soli]|uniref:BamA/TamA family outer membrane protein n=1 Tax=Adhaeribacter soli TaxID=2607655 RepID=A0A5N1J222_9BACT|nr:BamA/TamA family outer membrane protein [Adhaeribacter soli]KAA9340107.1 BamA/TamA family outer membrane protein [Adhaeribacter soli]